jgi:diguanylate cyclase
MKTTSPESGARRRRTTEAMLGIALSYGVDTALLMAFAAWVLHAGAAQRALVWLGIVCILGRFILVGICGRSLRLRLRGAQQLAALGRFKQRDASLARVHAQLQHHATHDSLTGLPNRVLLANRLDQAVATSQPFAACLLNLDRFQSIHDSMGRVAADALLKRVGQRLLSAVRRDDVVARTGDNEFLLLVHGVSTRPELERLASGWIGALSEPYRVNGTALHVSPSIGIACYPADATHSKELLTRADEAMHQARQNGRTLRFYDADVMSSSGERLLLEADLRYALATSQLQLHYQPKVELASDAIHSVEALLRWRHPTRGLVSPAQFLPIAEDTGLILPIGEWVLREACRQARVWQDQGLALRVSVNVSAIEFHQINFPSLLRAALAAHALDPSRFEIELTEATLMSNAERSVEVLEQLSRLGVSVAIDDFGTGYSSMLYLQRFPVDKLKIDRNFIRDLDTDSNDASIVHAIICLAHGLRLKVVAEGVETDAQLDILRRLGCDQYQGFLCSAAVAAEQLPALLTPTHSSPTAVGQRTFSKVTRLVRHRN